VVPVFDSIGPSTVSVWSVHTQEGLDSLGGEYMAPRGCVRLYGIDRVRHGSVQSGSHECLLVNA